jgi:hypothetical protein
MFQLLLICGVDAQIDHRSSSQGLLTRPGSAQTSGDSPLPAGAGARGSRARTRAGPLSAAFRWLKRRFEGKRRVGLGEREGGRDGKSSGEKEERRAAVDEEEQFTSYYTHAEAGDYTQIALL